MERVKLYCRGEDLGEVLLRSEGVRTEIRAAMPDPGDGLYRALLIGRDGQLPLGVMEGSWRSAAGPIAGICGQSERCSVGRPAAPFAFRRRSGGRPAVLPRCSRASFCEAACGPSAGLGGGGRESCSGWRCPWRRGSLFRWRPCSVWRRSSGWRAGSARSTPFGRRSPFCPANNNLKNGGVFSGGRENRL